ncbi:MAG TPA: serpin family protein [Trichocoleus sp.]
MTFARDDVVKTMTLKWLVLLALAAVVVASFLGCTRAPDQAAASGPTAGTPEPAPLPGNGAPADAVIDPQLVTAQNRFGFLLLSQLQQEQPDENLVVSPLSVFMALSLAQMGAKGDTLAAMEQTLQLETLDAATVNGAIASQIAALTAADPTAQLAMANSLWARAGGIELKPEFVQAAQAHYQAEVNTLDFDQPTALQAINRWVGEATAGKIPAILDQISSNDVLFLLNAIYFKGTWQTPFDPEQTAEAAFYSPGGSSTTHPLMSRSGDFLYSETDTFQAVSLPYGGGRLRMVVLLPQEGISPADLQRQLTADTWSQWTAELRRRPGSLKLPQFQLEYGASLNSTLSALGMEPAFDPDQANFSNLSDTSTHISEVKHKTYIEVNEAGTEAAGATSVGISVTSAPIDPPQPFEMVVNRPFFLAIEDGASGSLLFLSWIVNPAS